LAGETDQRGGSRIISALRKAEAEPARFPLRVAALDVGSNAIRFRATEFTDVATYTDLDGQRFAIRLGADAFTSGRLSPESISRAVAAAVHFRTRLDDLGIVRYRAVATSAVRESRNGGELVELIRRESGIHLETITGTEEARLVWLAVSHSLPLEEGRWLLADLGGGSLEISVVGTEGIEQSESHSMGTVRLLEELAGQDVDSPAFRHLVERYAGRLSCPPSVAEGVSGLAITGGNAETIADLVGRGRGGRAPSEITIQELGEVLERLTSLTFRRRVDELGLREDRADVIIPATIIFRRVAELAGSSRILIPRVGVREGILYDLADDVAQHRAHESEIDRISTAGALALGRRYRFDEAHARHVTDLALSLFDQLRDLHRLGEVSRRRLATGALLHDIGQFVSYRKHHKHSHYLVLNSELAGLGQQDIRTIALLTRYHRRSEPRDEHEGYSELSADAKLELQKLAAILRVADALDREHQRDIRSVRAEHRGREVKLFLDSSGDSMLERWALAKKAPMFERVFGVRLHPVQASVR
jgi:exopolyphosphatase / guanosine-5'-triphosphate,3'-diphosphate pyrophosphatase